MDADPFPDQPRLRWEHLTESERLSVATQMPSEVMDWEMYHGYYVRLDDLSSSVVYVEPLEEH